MTATRKWPPLLALPDVIEDGGQQDDMDALLVQATPQGGRSALAIAAHAASSAPSLLAALELLEAWSPAEEAKHPRWPKGTPGGLGGHFMKTGQRFSLHGIEYDVAFTAPGGLYAHVATKGDISKAKTVWIPSSALEQGKAVVKGVVRPPVDVAGYKSGKSGLKATTIDPYVQPDHDPSIPIPPDAPPGLTAERWQRFGRADQLRYIDLMHQFGAWGDSKAQTLVDAELAKKPKVLVDFVKGAYASQFGSSSSFSIGLLQTFSKWFQGGFKPTEAQLEADRKQYELAKQTQDAAARVIQWDLYNRVKAPDIAVFHGSGDTKQHWLQNWLGHAPIFSGLSQSQRFSAGAFGSTRVATPLAIRNIVMATTSADIYKDHGYGGEQEVAVGEPMRYDAAHTLVFNDSELSGAQQQWLTHQTQNGTDGSIIEILRANIEQGIPLPSLPEPANLQMHGSGQQWVAPPAAAKIGVEKLGYLNVDADGVPIAKPADQLDLHPGDYIEGMKGTRYIVIADPGSGFGVRYYKLTDTGTASGPMKPYTLGPIHDKSTGNQAYGGHTPSDTGESYEFQTELPFKKLAGHFDMPTQKATTGVQFVSGAWAQSGDQKFVKDLGVGGKFYFDGVPYEVEQVISPKQVTVKSLASGKTGTINGIYKTNYLKLKEGYSEEGVPTFNPDDYFAGVSVKGSELAPGDLFQTPSGDNVYQVSSASKPSGPGVSTIVATQVIGSKVGQTVHLDPAKPFKKLTPKPSDWTPPQIGDTLAYNGKKATVTKMLKGGQVQINLAPGVVKLNPDDPALAGLFSAEKYELGPKMKVKDMTPGQKFHGGTGGTVRPYMLVALGQKQKGKNGSFATVRNLDTGEESLVGYQKAYALLVPKGFAVSAETKTPGVDEGAGEVFNPAAWKPADSTLGVSQLKVGDKFLSPYALDQTLEVTDDKGSAWVVKNLLNGSSAPMVKTDILVHPLVPSNVMPAVAFDPALYTVGEEKKLADLKPGDIFKGPKAGKFYLVTKTGAKSGLSAVDLSNGNKSGPWQYSKVAPVMEHITIAAPGKEKTPGSAVLLSSLTEGEQFTIDGALHQVVAPSEGKEKNATVAAVLPGGGLGFPGKVGFYPGLAVTFHASKADAEAAAAKSEAEKVALTATDAPSVEGLGWLPESGIAFSPKSKTGGGYFFTKAKNADEGAILVGKDGKAYKVKVAGADPIVSDGSEHFFMPGEWNMKIADWPFEDNAPPLTQAHDALESQVAATTPPVIANKGDQTLGELAPKTGDFILSGSTVMKLEKGKGPGLWFGQDVKGPKHQVGLLEGFVPDAYAIKQPDGQWQLGPSGAAAMPLVKHIDAGPTFSFGKTGPPGVAAPVSPSGVSNTQSLVADAAVQADLNDQWVNNDLVKVPASMLKPGQLYKSMFGSTLLWHGNAPLGNNYGWAELVQSNINSEDAAPTGAITMVKNDFVPSQVGPIVDFHQEDWEPVSMEGFPAAGKELMSNLQAGAVFSMGDGKPMKVVATVPSHGNLVVVSSVPLSVTGQEAPHVISVTPGTQVQLWQPKQAPSGIVLGPATATFLPLKGTPGSPVLPSQLEVGDIFQAGETGSGDPHTYKVTSVGPVAGAPGAHLGLAALGDNSGWAQDQEWHDTATAGKWTLVAKGSDVPPSGDPNDYVSTGTQGLLYDMPAGTTFKYVGGETPLRVLSTNKVSATQGSADVMDASGKVWSGVDGSVQVATLSYLPGTEAPHPLASFKSWKDNVKAGDLQPGDEFAQGSGASYAIFKVTGPLTENGEVPWKVVEASPKTSYVVGDIGTIDPATVPDWYRSVGEPPIPGEGFVAGDKVTMPSKDAVGVVTDVQPGNVKVTWPGDITEYGYKPEQLTKLSGQAHIADLKPGDNITTESWASVPAGDYKVVNPAFVTQSEWDNVPPTILPSDVVWIEDKSGGLHWLNKTATSTVTVNPPEQMPMIALPLGAKFTFPGTAGNDSSVYTIVGKNVSVTSDQSPGDYIHVQSEEGDDAHYPKDSVTAFKKMNVVQMPKRTPGSDEHGDFQTLEDMGFAVGDKVQSSVTGQKGTVQGPGGYTDQVKVLWDNGKQEIVDNAPTALHGLPKKYGETDEYLVQALVDAWHKNDEGAYFDADLAIAQHLGIDMSTAGQEPDEWLDDVGAKVDQYVKEVIADRQIKAPGGGDPFNGQEPGAPDSYFNTSTGNLTVGTEFEDSGGDKWVVTSTDEYHTVAEPIGQEGEGLEKSWAQEPDSTGEDSPDEQVHVLYWNPVPGTSPPAGYTGPGTKLNTLSPGSQFQVSGYQGVATYKVIGPSQSAGLVDAEWVSGGGDATVKNMPFGGELEVTPVLPGPPADAKTTYVAGLPKGTKVWYGGNQYSVGEKDADGKITLHGWWANFPDVQVGSATEVQIESSGLPTPKKGEVWKGPSGVSYEITSVKKGVPYGKQIITAPASGAKGYGSVTPLDIGPGWSRPAVGGEEEWAPSFGGLAPNTEGLSLLQLPVGALVQQSKNPLDPTIDEPAVWKVSGFSGGQAELTMVQAPTTKNSSVTMGQVGDSQHFDVGMQFDNVAMPRDQEAAAAPAIPSESPLKPYSAKSKTGGGYYFADLGDLKTGDKFTDKTGTVYEVITKTTDGYYVKFVKADAPEGTTPFSHPAGARVKLVKS